MVVKGLRDANRLVQLTNLVIIFQDGEADYTPKIGGVKRYVKW